jgi:hypothetical protein
MSDIDALRTRFRGIVGFLDKRGRRLFAANEALTLGHGGVTAVSAASGIARSTINRGIAELKAGGQPNLRASRDHIDQEARPIATTSLIFFEGDSDNGKIVTKNICIKLW